MNILIFAGTTEGRILSERLSLSKVSHFVSVATEYGKELMQKNPYLTLLKGRMDAEEMQSFISEKQISLVIDATHPYADLVTKEIKKAVGIGGCQYIRLLRETKLSSAENDSTVYFFKDDNECISALLKGSGNIFLTTGSKSISNYTKNPELSKRIYARVLPGKESIEICEKAGLKGKQIIAMQGPFSEEMNIALLHQFEIQYMVTKQSGMAGGFLEKYTAAQKSAVKLFVIGHAEEEQGVPFSAAVNKIEEFLGIRLKDNFKAHISLCGVGMGNADQLTMEVKDIIKHAHILIGSKRLIEQFKGEMQHGIQTKPSYNVHEILQYIEKICKDYSYFSHLNIAVLYSGDSGFYSGCEKLEKSLRDAISDQRISGTMKVYPGISSVSMLSAKLGISWQNAKIISIHGIKEESSRCLKMEEIRFSKESFVLLSEKEDLVWIRKYLNSIQDMPCEIYAGFQLSYPEERIFQLVDDKWSSKDGEFLTEDALPQGLYCCYIKNSHFKNRKLSYGLQDSSFIRGNVPMTKEEVREIILSKLEIYEDSVLYDIGSGTGSIAIEAARISPKVNVYAIEQKEEAISILKKNKVLFSVPNMKIVPGTAPEALDGLPAPTHAFIGGSSGKWKEIIEVLYHKNPHMKVIISGISMETIGIFSEISKIYSLEKEDIVQIQISRAEKIGNYHLMKAQNPIFLYSFRFKESEDV